MLFDVRECTLSPVGVAHLNMPRVVRFNLGSPQCGPLHGVSLLPILRLRIYA